MDGQRSLEKEAKNLWTERQPAPKKDGNSKTLPGEEGAMTVVF